MLFHLIFHVSLIPSPFGVKNFGIFNSGFVIWISSGVITFIFKFTKIFKTHSQEDFASVQGTAGKTHVHLSLLWTPTETPQSELVIIGTKGTAEFSEHGWKISTFDFEQSGPAISQEKQFETQWINFRGKLLGEIPLSTKDPDFYVLEKTLKQIENIYDNEDTK